MSASHPTFPVLQRHRLHSPTATAPKRGRRAQVAVGAHLLPVVVDLQPTGAGEGDDVASPLVAGSRGHTFSWPASALTILFEELLGVEAGRRLWLSLSAGTTVRLGFPSCMRITSRAAGWMNSRSPYLLVLEHPGLSGPGHACAPDSVVTGAGDVADGEGTVLLACAPAQVRGSGQTSSLPTTLEILAGTPVLVPRISGMHQVAEMTYGAAASQGPAPVMLRRRPAPMALRAGLRAFMDLTSAVAVEGPGAAVTLRPAPGLLGVCTPTPAA